MHVASRPQAVFIAEQDKRTFNVGAGGRASLLGQTWDADERQDELAFVLQSEKAQYSTTHFDLRSIRAILYQIPPAERSVLQTNLMCWADSYDALICH